MKIVKMLVSILFVVCALNASDARAQARHWGGPGAQPGRYQARPSYGHPPVAPAWRAPVPPAYGYRAPRLGYPSYAYRPRFSHGYPYRDYRYTGYPYTGYYDPYLGYDPIYDYPYSGRRYVPNYGYQTPPYSYGANYVNGGTVVMNGCNVDPRQCPVWVTTPVVTTVETPVMTNGAATTQAAPTANNNSPNADRLAQVENKLERVENRVRQHDQVLRVDEETLEHAAAWDKVLCQQLTKDPKAFRFDTDQERDEQLKVCKQILGSNQKEEKP